MNSQAASLALLLFLGVFGCQAATSRKSFPLPAQEAPVLRIACLGDSNTSSNWRHWGDPGFVHGSGWCEQLVTELDEFSVQIENHAVGGARAIDSPPELLTSTGLALDGAHQLAAALAGEPPDLVLLAFVTNDLNPRDPRSPEEIVEALATLAGVAEAAGSTALVATAPAVFPKARTGASSPDPLRIEQVNALIRKTFPDDRRLDFDQGFLLFHYFDEMHLNTAGHTLRARQAAGAIRRALGLSPPRAAGRP